MDQAVYSSDELRDGLEAAEEHLSEAEEILWVTAGHVEPDKYAIQMEEMTERLWELQQDIDGLKGNIDETSR